MGELQVSVACYRPETKNIFRVTEESYEISNSLIGFKSGFELCIHSSSTG
jgi:hypothetical protein